MALYSLFRSAPSAAAAAAATVVDSSRPSDRCKVEFLWSGCACFLFFGLEEIEKKKIRNLFWTIWKVLFWCGSCFVFVVWFSPTTSQIWWWMLFPFGCWESGPRRLCFGFESSVFTSWSFDFLVYQTSEFGGRYRMFFRCSFFFLALKGNKCKKKMVFGHWMKLFSNFLIGLNELLSLYKNDIILWFSLPPNGNVIFVDSNLFLVCEEILKKKK